MAVNKNDGTVHLPRPPVVKRGRGRPTKLTPELIERIRLGMSSGAYIETASAQAGINPDTLRDWLRKGAAGKSALHRQFSATIEKAEAEAEMRALATIQEFGRGMMVDVVTTTVKGTGPNAITETKTERRPVREWTAAAWYLERRRPQRWGRRVVELQGKDGTALSPLGQVLIMLPPKEGLAMAGQAEEVRRAARLLSSDEPGGNGGNGGKSPSSR